MTEYEFAIAHRYSAPFLVIRTNLPSEDAAILHAFILAREYPQAWSVNVERAGLAVVQVLVSAADRAARAAAHVRASHARLEQSRRLLEATAPRETRPETDD